MGMMARKVMAGASGASGVSITSPNHPDLIAMYTMDNISGTTLVDESPNGNDATLVNGPVAVTGVLGNALQFDGNNDHASVPVATFEGSEASICFFWKPLNASGADERFLGIGQNAPDDNVKVLLRTVSGTLQLLVASGSTTVNIITGPTLVNGTDYFIRCNLGTLSELFVDEVSHGTAAGDMSLTADTYFLGASRNATTNANGNMDQFRHFSVLTTTPQGAALYNGGTGA